MPLPPLLAERLRKRNIITADQGEPNHPNSAPNKTQNTLAHASEHHKRHEDDSDHHHPRSDDQKEERTNFENPDDQHEEVFAEDYSDDEADGQSVKSHSRNGHSSDDITDKNDDDYTDEDQDDGDEADKSGDELIEEEQNTNQRDIDYNQHCIETVIGCPNKYNVYHTCSQYCKDRYSNPRMRPRKSELRLLASLLRYYPISAEWKPVYEPGLKTFYFYNMITDQVTWLPLGHPAANATVSVDIVRQMMLDQERNKRNSSSNEKKLPSPPAPSPLTIPATNESPSTSSNKNNPASSSGDYGRKPDNANTSASYRDSRHGFRSQHQSRQNTRNNLDPFDPASYSDIEPGKWSDGLEVGQSKKAQQS